MASDLERLQRKRSTLRATTTRLLTKIEGELKENPIRIQELEEALDQLQLKESSLEKLNDEIEKHIVDLNELDDEVSGSQQYMEKIVLWRGRVNRAIKGINSRDSRNTSNPGNAENTGNRGSSGTVLIRENASVKLPRITIAKFMGDASLWQEFWGQFDVAIHKNTGLSKIEKMNYLKSYLGGSAANAIQGLSLSETNYDAAIQLLTERFGRKDLIINAHMSKLLNLVPVKKPSDLHGLRTLYDDLEIQVRSLESIGVLSDTYGSLLCPILLKVVPTEIALEFSRRLEGDEGWTVSEFLSFLKKEIQSRERATTLSQSGTGASSSNDQNSRNSWKTSHGPRTASSAALNTCTSQICPFCDSSHQAEECHNFSIDDRREKLKKSGKCFICLKKGHISRFCRQKDKSCNKCGRRHHPSICKGQANDADKKNQADVSVNANVTQSDVSVNSIVPVEHKAGLRKAVLLQTARVLVKGERNSVDIRCLLDGGSQRTFIKQSVSRSLRLPIVGEESINIHTFGSEKPKDMRMKRVRCILCNVRNPGQNITVEALEVPRVTSAVVSVPGEDLEKEMQQRGLPLADDTMTSRMKDEDLALLIGSDNYWDVVTGTVERLSGNLVALETIFGWAIQGPAHITNMMVSVNSVLAMKVATEEDVSERLRAFWELDAIGITDAVKTTTAMDEELMKDFEKTIKFVDGRYEVALPWKSEHDAPPDNLAVAERRFKVLQKQFSLNADLFCQYSAVINEYLKEGIVEKVPETSDSDALQNSYYMPHRAVIREDKATTKLRVVFDASSHAKNCSSLNDCLHTGPNLNPDLLDTLLQFRWHKVAVVADIEKAFLQIKIKESDQDVLRFLWLEECTGKMSQKQITLKMTRVPFGVTCSPFLLSATLRHHISKFVDCYPATCKTLSDCLYVDDLATGRDSVPAAFKCSNEARQILNHCGMNLRQWRSNSKELEQCWQKEFGFKSQDSISAAVKVLGLKWQCDTDCFMFDFTGLLHFLTTMTNTKRFVLQAVARIYDPLGLITPFVIPIKCLFQDLWISGIAWDDPIPEGCQQKFKLWCKDLVILQKLEIPRCYFFQMAEDSVSEVELHGFSDSSERAYAAVVYLRYVTKGGRIGISLVASKCRVAPLKKLTLPRLELMGALICARLTCHLKKKFDKVQLKVYQWTDSQVVLHWIRAIPTRWKPFVANRVSEIQNLVSPESWNHCKGTENPADFPTRGLRAVDLINNKMWWNGPQWLSEPNTCWSHDAPRIEVDEADVERRVSCKREDSLLMQCNVTPVDSAILKLENYSSLDKVVRITAWVFRFINNSNQLKSKIKGPLTVEELERGMCTLIKIVQQEMFPMELIAIKKKCDVPPTSKLFGLQPFLDDDGCIRAKGRLQKANIAYGEKFPYILLSDHRLSWLLVQQAHLQVMHSGVCATLTQVRERYWILRARQLVRSCIRRCVTCQKLKALPGQEVPAPMPADRIAEAPPFEVVGVDFAGPLVTKTQKKEKKSYIALFTCAVTRAIHLEIVSDLGTDKFLLAFRRFISRRGLCRIIYSDNALTFKRADKDLKELWKNLDQDQLKDFFGTKGIKWKYIVERAAWWGGFWERLVRSVKGCLRKILGHACLSFEELTTVLAEVEAIINSRPLTYIYDDLHEPCPLTPAHFLIGTRLTSLPPISKQPVTLTATKEQLTNRWKFRQRLVNSFWNRWRKEYLQELRSSHASGHKGKSLELHLGDVVLVHNDRTPKHMWKMARVVETFIGRDNKIRACAVKFANGQVLRRPVQLLYCLEL